MLQRGFCSARWAEFVPGLKTADEVAEIRRRVLLAFEYAESEPDPGERARLLTFVVVGGNECGVELVGVTARLVQEILSQERYAIASDETEVVLIERGNRLLPMQPEGCSARALHALEMEGATVLLGAKVTEIAADHVKVGDRRIEARTCVWAARLEALPPAAWFGLGADRTAPIGSLLSGFRNQMLTLADRLLAYASARMGMRLVTGSR
jgi:NADH dehydrogenase